MATLRDLYHNSFSVAEKCYAAQLFLMPIVSI
jgi:hypothetical protein